MPGKKIILHFIVNKQKQTKNQLIIEKYESSKSRMNNQEFWKQTNKSNPKIRRGRNNHYAWKRQPRHALKDSTTLHQYETESNEDLSYQLQEFPSKNIYKEENIACMECHKLANLSVYLCRLSQQIHNRTIIKCGGRERGWTKIIRKRKKMKRKQRTWRENRRKRGGWFWIRFCVLTFHKSFNVFSRFFIY